MTKIILYDSYFKMIKNSAGTKMFRNLYLEKDGRKFDATENGEMSCAFFVSNILLIFGLISEGHATVESTTRDMIKKGWKKISLKTIKPGDVIVWEKRKMTNRKFHYHNGFYIGNKKAISNDSKKGMPVIHKWDYSGKRKIVAVYRYPKFE